MEWDARERWLQFSLMEVEMSELPGISRVAEVIMHTIRPDINGERRRMELLPYHQSTDAQRGEDEGPPATGRTLKSGKQKERRESAGAKTRHDGPDKNPETLQMNPGAV